MGTYHINQGDFISEVGLHVGLMLEGPVESCCEIVASSDIVQIVEWDRRDLMKLLRNHRSLFMSLKSVLSWDIISKLKNQRQIVIAHEISDTKKWTQKRDEQTEARYRAILFNILS